MTKEKVIIGGIYKHWRGNLYKVVDLVFDSGACDEIVIYKQLYDGNYPLGTKWARDCEEFLEYMPSGDKRFILMGIDVKEKT